jgi:hypothetical protein
MKAGKPPVAAKPQFDTMRRAAAPPINIAKANAPGSPIK